MVSLEEAQALDLIPDLQSDDPAKADAACARVQAMIKSKQATLLAWPMVKLADGDRSTSETISEKRYPTEFEPPQEQAAGPAATTPPMLPPRTPADTPLPENIVGTTFETRNVGPTLEVEARVRDEGKRVYLNLVSQRVELIEMEKFENIVTQHKVVQATQPLFADSKSTITLTVQSGQRQLIGVHKLGKPANQIEFHLVRAVVSKTD